MKVLYLFLILYIKSWLKYIFMGELFLISTTLTINFISSFFSFLSEQLSFKICLQLVTIRSSATFL